MAATKDMLVVTCADCTEPGVQIYNKRTLNRVGSQPGQSTQDLKANAAFFQKMHTQKLERLTNGDHYNIETNDSPDIGYTQIFLASNNSIELLERQITRNESL